MIFPTVAIGEGRTYASAARKPGAFVSSGGTSVGLDKMEGVLSLSFMFPGLTVDSSENSLLVLGPAFGTKLVVDWFEGDRGSGERGRG